MQASLAVLAGAAAWAMAVAHGAAFAWALVVPAAASLFWRARTLPGPLAAALRLATRVSVGAVVAFGLFLCLYPVLDDQRVTRLAVLAAALLVPLAGGALLVTPVVGPTAGALPMGLALLSAAAFNPAAPIGAPLAVGGAAALAFLIASAERCGPAAGRRRLLRLAGFLAASGAIALGIARFLPWAQPKVEEATARVLNPAVPTARPGLSETSRLGDIERLALSPAVVLRVWTPAPRKLRARVFTSFDGRAWRGPRSVRHDLARAGLSSPEVERGFRGVPGTTYRVAAPPAHGGAPAVTRIRVVDPPGALVAPAAAELVRLEADRLRADRFGVLEPPPEPPVLYAVAQPWVVSAVAAPEDPGDDPALLAVPEDTDARVRALAARLAEGGPAPDERLRRTLELLWSEYRYALDTGPMRSPQPVAEFLFETRRGWCEHFASAAVVLLRLEGVPARYVTGFSMDAAPKVAGHYVVRDADAHAWVEAWLPGRGWVEADPTPAGDYAAMHASLGEGPLDRALAALRGVLAEVAMAVRARDLRALAAALVDLLRRPPVAVAFAAAVIGALILAGRRRRRGRHALAFTGATTVDPDLAALARGLDRFFLRRGCARPAHRAPLEHLRSAAERLPAGALAVGETAVACLYRARYAGKPVSADEMRAAARRLDQVGDRVVP